ncbi:MAG TPA: 2-C-methyl-D-erythritol 2,4-cyclodiphosphate synthase [Gemmatimonadales bacterium]|nr:2-C-methyl-D-erythritol 2,4-cyclodiphosphate synthase [Gemmatimonadales bacterium]
MKIGIGYDSHRYAAGRPLRLGGATIPHTHGLAGHSDADAVLHAITDALLGAAALGDIGTFFPNDDPQWKNADSARFVKGAVDALKANRLVVGQVDVTVIAERPKLGPYVQQMRAATARALGVTMEQVSIKAKTNEGMGWVGRHEGIACIAVATVMEASG